MASRCTIPLFLFLPIPPIPLPQLPFPNLDFGFEFNLYCPLD
jgi:hypothetical protein